MECSLPGSSVHGIFQARILEWVAMPFSRGSSWPRDGIHMSMSPTMADGFFTTSATWKSRTVDPNSLIAPYWIICICLYQNHSYPLKKVKTLLESNSSVQFSSVTKSCPTLCNPTNRNTPGLPVHHQLPEPTQTHVHWVGDAIQLSHPLSSSSPPVLNLSQHQNLLK